MMMDKTQLGKPAPWLQRSGWTVLPLLLIVSIATFWQCVTLPFIQDDWGFLRLSQTTDINSLLLHFFDFRGALMYRPAGLTYLALLFKAFGETAWPSHVLALCIHVLNAFMVLRLMGKLTEDQPVAVICSLIYASAVAVHLDPLCWAVGIFDLGGAFFFLTSIALFLSGRTFAAALSFFVGTLFKESVFVLPGVLVALEMSRMRKWAMQEVQSLVWRLLPLVAVLAVVAGLKMIAGISPMTLPASHPYVLAPIGGHVLDNAYRYCGWMLQSFIPFGTINNSIFLYLPIILGLLAAAMLIFRRAGRTSSLLAGLLLWILLALLPVLFLPNHTYRYYATYALPPFLCVILLLAKEMLGLIGLRERKDLLLVCAGTLIILASIVQSNRVFRQGLQQETLSDSTNGLIRRASFVGLVRSSLLTQLPRPAEGATILLGGVDLWSFNKESGPHVWYNDDSLRIYTLADLRYSLEGFYIEDPVQSQVEAYTGPQSKRIDIAAAKLYAFQLSGSRLQAMTPAELQRIAEMQTGANKSVYPDKP